jgi:hypothetical protein
MRRRFVIAAMAGVALAVFAGAANAARGSCPHTTVQDVEGICLDGDCPPGIQSYWATIVNKFPHKLYITYVFRAGTRSVSMIPGGLELQPNSAISQPIGLGRNILPKEKRGARIGRLRILECGTDPKIRFKWRRG